jgi:hypothetical protein
MNPRQKAITHNNRKTTKKKKKLNTIAKTFNSNNDEGEQDFGGKGHGATVWESDEVAEVGGGMRNNCMKVFSSYNFAM